MSTLPTANQVSAGGVVFRKNHDLIEVALILVGPKLRWQLPKGTVNPEESTEQAAQREVREEAGIEVFLLDLIEPIEYWYYSVRNGQRIRYHKYVYFYLMQYRSGDVNDHDHEVLEARWVEINQAITMLNFESEKNMVRRTLERILSKEEAHTPQDLEQNPQEGNAGA
jgi:8-oxo-dGTP pyrophosphatase MutT (NUDIX family)